MLTKPNATNISKVQARPFKNFKLHSNDCIFKAEKADASNVSTIGAVLSNCTYCHSVLWLREVLMGL